MPAPMAILLRNMIPIDLLPPMAFLETGNVCVVVVVVVDPVGAMVVVVVVVVGPVV